MRKLSLRLRNRRGSDHGPREFFQKLEQRVLLSASVDGGILTVLGLETADNMAIVAGPAPGQVSLNGVPDVVDGTQFDGVDQITVRGLGGDDRIEVGAGVVDTLGNAIGVQLEGGDDDDTLIGGDGDDTLIGGAGDDSLDGGAGSDTADYSGASSYVRIGLNSGKVPRDGDGGKDTLQNVENATGSAFNDNIKGNDNDNVIDGGAGNDKIHGGDGDDTIDAGDGNNRVTGGDGDDDITSGDGNDRINSGDGNDTIDAGDGNNRVNSADGDDNITTGSGDDKINSGGGNDTIDAGDGDNRVNSGEGEDTITSGDGDDKINSGDDNDTIDAGDGDNRVNSGDGDDTITSGDGNDKINSGDGNDAIDAGDGHNRVNSGDGDDDITTGSGNDKINAGDGDDTIDSGTGNDKIRDGGSYQQVLQEVVFTNDAAQLTGTSQGKKDKHLYSYTAQADGQLQVTIQQVAGRWVEVQIQDSLENELIQLKPHKGPDSGTIAMVNGETYRIRIRSTDRHDSDYIVDLALS